MSNNTLATTDGFDDDIDDRVIRGKIIKSVDGRLSCDDRPFPENKPLIVQGVARVAQHWLDGKPVESIFVTPENPVDIDKLNAAIPKEDWEDGFDGEPRPPWQMNFVVYFIDELDGATYTMLNSTFGMRQAYRGLCDQVKTMRMLRGSPVTPVVTIGNTIMKTKFGSKARPEFNVIEWKGLAPRPAQEQRPLLKTVPKPTSEEIIDDELPF
jgi:hypothetical protein